MTHEIGFDENTLPATDTEAMTRLRLLQRGLTGETMAQLFDVRRKLGDDLRTAYAAAIRASLPAEDR